MPKEYRNWPTIYTWLARWAKNGVLQKAFLMLQENGAIEIKVTIVSLDSTSIEVHPDGMGALKKWTPIYREVTWRLEHKN